MIECRKNIKISVLMSVYNETRCQIEMAIDSVLKQTFKELELIIVNDNPDSEEIEDILNKIRIKDDRVIIIKNDKNVGLAISLNKAANIAKGDIFARVDADDISDYNRFEKEYAYIESGYDLVTTGFHYINENAKDIDGKIVYYSEKMVGDLLPYGNTIHHPTTMMTRKIFEKAGGYRNFPCAQDYDLWLRMYEKGAKIFMINEDLFAYRVRSQSITESKRIKQIATMQYIRKLYHERQKKGVDSYSLSDYEEYLRKRKVNTDGDRIYELYKEGREVKKKSFIKKMIYFIKISFTCPFLIRMYIDKVKFVVRKKILGRQ